MKNALRKRKESAREDEGSSLRIPPPTGDHQGGKGGEGEEGIPGVGQLCTSFPSPRNV